MSYKFPYRISLIETKTASASASLTFTQGINSNFSSYLIKVRKLLPATNATQLLMTWSTDGGSNYLSTNYLYSNLLTDSTTSRTYGKSSGTTSSIPLSTATISSTTERDYNCDILLYDISSGSFCGKCTFHCTYYSSGALASTMIGGGMNTGTTAVNAIKFAMNSGNITSGSISLYGIQQGGFLY